jgi:predicted metal-dependent peptidase
MKTIDPYKYFGDVHPISIALREVSRRWFLCYSKLLAVEWVVTDDPSIPIAATDGRRLLLNEAGIAGRLGGKGDVMKMVFLLCHEALHALLNHSWRAKNLACKMTANVAADYIINAMIKNMGIPVWHDALLDEALSGDKSMEQLYRELLRDKPQTIPDLIDVELAEGEDEQKVIDEIESTNEGLILADKIQASKNEGTETRITDRGSPTSIRWQDVLWGLFTQRAENRWIAPMNRAIYATTGLVCFGRSRVKRGIIAVAVDTSGSINQVMLNSYMAEINSIRESVRPMTTYILSVDSRVHNVTELELEDPASCELKGGGGTKFQPAFDSLAERGITPDVLVYLTDGEASDLRTVKEPSYPVIWVSSGRVDMPFGVVIPA